MLLDGSIALGFLLCALLGLIPAAIAKNKGYKPFWFWVFGFCTFPIALIWALLIKPGWQKKCPHCAQMIKPDAKVCRYCSPEVE